MIELYTKTWETLNAKTLTFGGGETHVTLHDTGHAANILCRFGGNKDITDLFIYVDALRRYGYTVIQLFIPYFPGARQDRVCNPGEALTVKVYADLINQLKLNRVHIFDPHSDVAPALIDNVVVHKNHDFVSSALTEIATGSSAVLVSPDAGANKKIFDLAKALVFDHYRVMDVVRADKLRDVTTGKIIETTIYVETLEGKTCIIVDDICSYGGTFCALAKKLKEKGAEIVYLITSHYEDVADLQKLKDNGIARVFTTNSMEKVTGNITHATSPKEKSFVRVLDVRKYLA